MDFQSLQVDSAHSLPTTDPHRFLLSQSLKSKVAKLNSGYKDSFDWSIYDRLSEKYSSPRPRGGFIFNKTFKLVNYHQTCAKCHYAFEIDTYGRGCVHDCAFCYAKDQLTTHGYWNRPQPFPVDLSEIRKIMFTVFETDKSSKWRSILMRRIPLRIGSMSDSFMWMDLKYGVTHELLKILKFYRYPYIIFTRSDLVAHDKYIEVLDRNLATIQFSISGDNEALNRKIEPGAPSVERRLKALRKLNQNNFWATVRINPFFPKYPDGFFTDRESFDRRFAGKEVPTLDLMSDVFLSRIAEAEVKSVLVGFVRLSTWSVKRMSEALSIDMRSFFDRKTEGKLGDWQFSDSEIAHYYSDMKKKADDLGLRFSTCYIGNGEKDYFRYQNLWSNKLDCCDARGKVSGFQSSAQEIDWNLRRSLAPPEWLSKESPTVERNGQIGAPI